jgi:hypothetical protein
MISRNRDFEVGMSTRGLSISISRPERGPEPRCFNLRCSYT